MSRGRAIFIQFLLALVSVAVLGALSERLLGSYFAKHQSYIVEMWRYGQNHKRFTNDARSHEHVPHTTSLVMGKPVRIDQWGYRGEDRAVDSNARRILVLGDSMTFGFGVAEDEAFPARLEKALPGSQVWNSGVGNYNTEQEFATLPFHLPRLKPQEVVLGFFVNDLEPVQKGSRFTWLQNSLLYVLVSQLWWSYGDETRKDFTDYYHHWFETGWERWTRVTEAGLDELKRQNIPLKVLMIPELHSLGKGTFTADYKRVSDFFRTRGVPVCDGESFFPSTSTGGKEYWAARDDSHANAAAHRLLTKGLLECFYQNATALN